MASITVVNMTNTLLNSTTVYDGVYSSVRNGLNPGEFYVHSAGGIYELDVRYFAGRATMYRENWEEVGNIVGQVLLNLLALGLSIFGVGEVIAAGAAAARAAPAAWAAANVAQKAAATVFNMSLSGFAAATGGAGLDIGSLVLGIQDLTIDEIPADAKWTNISGYDDRVFVVTGGLKVDLPSNPASATRDATLEPLKITEIKRADFEEMRKKNEIYEETRLGHVIVCDEQGKPYYIDSTGKKVYDLSAKETRPPNPYEYTSTSQGLTGNDRGEWTPEVYTLPSMSPVAVIDGFELRDDPGHGVINLRAFYDLNKMTAWVRDEMGGSSAFSHEVHFPGETVKSIEVREEEGYGIIDMRVYTDAQQKPDWIIGNTSKDSKTHDYTYEVPSNMFLVGAVGKKQGTYGLVDVKFVLAPRPT